MQDKIDLKIKEVANCVNFLPAVTIIHDIRDASVLWMCDKGLKGLNITLSEVKAMKPKDYYDRFFNPEDAKDYTPKILALLERNNDDAVTYFQQVRVNHHEKWTWHMSSTKILMRDDDANPFLIITLSMPIDNMHSMTQKASKILEENNFLRENIHEFAKLSKREIEILKHLAKGESALDCGNALFISPQTVETHRKNIRKKLGTNSFFELSRYARSFDLI